jgi:hypothetical protein
MRVDYLQLQNHDVFHHKTGKNSMFLGQDTENVALDGTSALLCYLRVLPDADR